LSMIRNNAAWCGC